MTGFTYRGLHRLCEMELGRWKEIEEYYVNPHAGAFEAEAGADNRWIMFVPDMVGYQDGRIHVEYCAGPDRAWIEWDRYERLWVFTGRSGAFEHERYTACALDAAVYKFIPMAAFPLLCAAVIKSRGYQRNGMEIHRVPAWWFRERCVFPNYEIEDNRTYHNVRDALMGYDVEKGDENA